ncbi:MAG: 3-phosphoshikimate 1-carboxyvinyltransferase [Flavobacteriaceae bacterium TMED179]|nr:MAG: 3-phosphoshikimate 1-carboxyvinyltransferase [Flavobacteriaceae bacterium TMED179]|tara:strand:- start:86 stop:1309 length:1224 start_codon:yes stop_codon:yes gene_type:complete
MNLKVSQKNRICNGKINITGSKSETNRLLLLQAFYRNFKIRNKSNSDDSSVMQNALKSDSDFIDIQHAGTAMRFLTAYYSQLEGREIVLTGSSRMQERPIKILVDALRSIGACIDYIKKEGYPPLRIKGAKLNGGSLSLPADVSSQYISALLMLGSVLKSGIELNLTGKITSIPYINMTLKLLANFGVKTEFKNQCISVKENTKLNSVDQVVESDWSSASYFFSIASLADKAKIHLTSFKTNSLQGDAILRIIYKELGVNSYFEKDNLILRKENTSLPEKIQWDLSDSPDIAQTIVVTCYGLGVGCDLDGLHTLKIKETDRLVALDLELSKLGAKISVTDKSLHLSPGNNFRKDVSISTYNDHRMAMAFAPLALKTPIGIDEAQVVSKSYPSFWKDLKMLNFKMELI